jgi:hypothetical protein
MQIILEVLVNVEKESGKFVSKDEIIDQIVEEVSGVDPGSIYVDESVYTVTDWEVNVK